MFVNHPKMQTCVNGYLINTGDQLVLVDTGGARLDRPNLGRLAENLKASGYRPEQVDMVLITHFHGDHVGGLLNADNSLVFPKADVRLSQTEADYWTAQENADKAPESRKPTFKMARDLAATLTAAGKWKPFIAGDEVAPGIKSMAVPGHTPGHSAYLVDSDGQRLVLWGDLVHSYAVQFTKPGVTIDFDSDQTQAAITRLRLFQQLAADKTLVGGAHLPFPGLGHVRADGSASYGWVPVEFGPVNF
jgi:glyoxylase-like metal-dependent hydrolase (beta-lactamase superfamily II)